MNNNSTDVTNDISTDVMNFTDVINCTDVKNFTDVKNYNPTDFNTWEMSLSGKVIITVIWGIILLVGILGNLLVITLILLVKTMRSAVNLALLSLAIVDMMVVVFMPIAPFSYLYVEDSTIIGSAHFCTFLNSIDRPAIVCSVLTFLLVGVERYTAVCHPLRFRGMWTPKRVCLLLGIIWAISVGVCVPYGYASTYVEFEVGNATIAYCLMSFQNTWFRRYDTAVTCIFLYLPVPVLLLLYGKIILALRAKAPRRNTQGTDAKVGQKSRSQIALMLVVLLAIFLISVIPFRIFCVIFDYDEQLLYAEGQRFAAIVEWSTRILLYINHSTNPIIYFLMCRKFREAFIVVFCRRCNSDTSFDRSVLSTSAN